MRVFSEPDKPLEIQFSDVLPGTKFESWQWMVFTGQLGVAREVGDNGQPVTFFAVKTYDLDVVRNGKRMYFKFHAPKGIEDLPPLFVEAHADTRVVSDVDGPKEVTSFTHCLCASVWLLSSSASVVVSENRLRQRAHEARVVTEHAQAVQAMRDRVGTLTPMQLAPYMQLWGQFKGKKTSDSAKQQIVRQAIGAWARAQGMHETESLLEAVGDQLSDLVKGLTDYYQEYISVDTNGQNKDTLTKLLRAHLRPLLEDLHHPLQDHHVDGIVSCLVSNGRFPRRFRRMVGDEMHSVMVAVNRAMKRELVSAAPAAQSTAPEEKATPPRPVAARRGGGIRLNPKRLPGLRRDTAPPQGG